MRESMIAAISLKSREDERKYICSYKLEIVGR